MILRPLLGLFMAIAFAVIGGATVRRLYAVYGLDLQPLMAGLAFSVTVIVALAFAFPWRPE